MNASIGERSTLQKEIVKIQLITDGTPTFEKEHAVVQLKKNARVGSIKKRLELDVDYATKVLSSGRQR